jgi:hypothetical protein
MRLFVLLGIGCVLMAFGAAVLMLPMISILLGPPLALAAVLCTAIAVEKSCLGRILVAPVLLYLLWTAGGTAWITSNVLLDHQRRQFSREHGLRDTMRPLPPIPYGQIWKWFIAPTVIAGLAWGVERDSPRKRAVVIWLALLAIFPLSILFMYLVSFVWPLSA